MKLFIVRHAETDFNAKGLIQGSVDKVLNLTGIKQAKLVAERLKDEHFDVAFCSHMKRAKRTAKEIVKFHPEVELVEREEVRERKAGIFEGRPKAEYRPLYTKETFHTLKPEGSESLEEAQARIVVFYNEILENYKGKNVLLVSHGAVIIVLLLHIFNKALSHDEYMKLRHKNTGLTVVEISDDKNHTVHVLNSSAHLS